MNETVKSNKRCTKLKQLLSLDDRVLRSVKLMLIFKKFGVVYLNFLEEMEKGKRKVFRKIDFNTKEKSSKTNGIWEFLFKETLIKEGPKSVPNIVYKYLLQKLQGRVSDLSYISKAKRKPFAHYINKYIILCKKIVNKHSQSISNQVQFSGEFPSSANNNNLHSTTKLTRQASLKYHMSISNTKENSRLYSPQNETNFSGKNVKTQQKKDFPVNIFLLTSKHLQNRPAEKFEIFLGKYVHSYLIKDLQDPNNKNLPFSRNEKKINGNICNHMIDKQNLRAINLLSRSISHVKVDARNSLSPTKLPKLSEKSRSRMSGVNENLTLKNNCSETFFTKNNKISSSSSPVKVKIKKVHIKSIREGRNKTPNFANNFPSSFSKNDFYYS